MHDRGNDGCRGLRRPSPKGEGRRNQRRGPLASPAVAHYRCLLCNVALVPMLYSRNVAIRGHYGEFTRWVVEPLAINAHVTMCDGTLNTESYCSCFDFRAIVLVAISPSRLRPRRIGLL